MGTVKRSWIDGVNEWLRRLNPDSIPSSRVAPLLPIGSRMSILKAWLQSGHQSSHLKSLIPILMCRVSSVLFRASEKTNGATATAKNR